MPFATPKGSCHSRHISRSIYARIDQKNGMRLQRAWEVHRATGRPLSAWQAKTPPPLVPLANSLPLVLDADRDWLGARIERRFESMVHTGALDEARKLLPIWDETLMKAWNWVAPDITVDAVCGMLASDR